MHIIAWLQKNNLTQADLAKIIRRGVAVEPKDRVRAHRIWHGRVPGDEDMRAIYTASSGEVTANDFYHSAHTKKHTSKLSTGGTINGV